MFSKPVISPFVIKDSSTMGIDMNATIVFPQLPRIDITLGKQQRWARKKVPTETVYIFSSSPLVISSGTKLAKSELLYGHSS
jgi:hypothetical protein